MSHGHGIIALVPSTTMLLGSAASCVSAPSKLSEARLQRLSAGLIIGAVAIDLFPQLSDRLRLTDETDGPDLPSLLAGLAGFLVALVVMRALQPCLARSAAAVGRIPAVRGVQQPGRRYALKSLDLGEPDAEDEGEEEGAGADLEAPAAGVVGRDGPGERLPPAGVEGVAPSGGRGAFRRRLCLLCDRLAGGGRRRGGGGGKPPAAERRGPPARAASASSVFMESRGDLTARSRRTRKTFTIGGFGGLHAWPSMHELDVGSVAEGDPTARAQRAVPIPWTVVTAVVMDALVDGLLIGLTNAVSPSSSRLLAIATAIEMGVLGYSFARAVLRSTKRCLAITVVFLPPLALTGASLAAAVSAAQIKGSVTLGGLLAFGLVALLFLIFEELIAEAQEVEGGDKWHVSIWLYLGLLFSIGLDALL